MLSLGDFQVVAFIKKVSLSLEAVQCDHLMNVMPISFQQCKFEL